MIAEPSGFLRSWLETAVTLWGICTSIGPSLCCTVDHCSRTDSGGKDWKHCSHSETFYDLLWIPILGYITVAGGLFCRGRFMWPSGSSRPYSYLTNSCCCGTVNPICAPLWIWALFLISVGPISATQWLMICVAQLIHAALLIGVPDWIHTVWPLCASHWIHTLLMCATGKPYCWASQRHNGTLLSFWSL
jgi:hypothetical protein